jgi:hypothetical protein
MAAEVMLPPAGPVTLKAAAAAGLVTLLPPPDIVYWYVACTELAGYAQ